MKFIKTSYLFVTDVIAVVRAIAEAVAHARANPTDLQDAR